MSWNDTLLAMAIVTHEAGHDDVTEITEADEAEIHVLIRRQLRAFADGDADAAYALSSSAIRQTFGSADALLAMIRKHYPALGDPRQASFGTWAITPDGLGQIVRLDGRDGATDKALYLVVREGGKWRVNGALLLPRGTSMARDEAA